MAKKPTNGVTLAKRCGLCSRRLRYHGNNKRAAVAGLPVGANTHDLDAKSEMHYAHVSGKSRSRQQFASLPMSVWKKMGVVNHKGSRTCCYECHEVLMHNIVLSETALDKLSMLFKGKSFQQKVILLNRIFESGLNQMMPVTPPSIASIVPRAGNKSAALTRSLTP